MTHRNPLRHKKVKNSDLKFGHFEQKHWTYPLEKSRCLDEIQIFF